MTKIVKKWWRKLFIALREKEHITCDCNEYTALCGKMIPASWGDGEPVVDEVYLDENAEVLCKTCSARYRAGCPFCGCTSIYTCYDCGWRESTRT